MYNLMCALKSFRSLCIYVYPKNFIVLNAILVVFYYFSFELNRKEKLFSVSNLELYDVKEYQFSV